MSSSFPDHSAADTSIDMLLEKYLLLLHEYTSLRDQLNHLQRGMYQGIARANFTAERGLRFGRDHYDERMQASRRLIVSTDENCCPSFEVRESREEPSAARKVDSDDGQPEGIDGTAEGQQKTSDDGDHETSKTPEIQKMCKNDPLRWFGLLAPSALRQAQQQSIHAVEDILPRLVTVNAEMAAVEIEVRRARKRRAKAEAAAVRERPATNAVTEAIQAT